MHHQLKAIYLCLLCVVSIHCSLTIFINNKIRGILVHINDGKNSETVTDEVIFNNHAMRQILIIQFKLNVANIAGIVYGRYRIWLVYGILYCTLIFENLLLRLWQKWPTRETFEKKYKKLRINNVLYLLINIREAFIQNTDQIVKL